MFHESSWALEAGRDGLLACTDDGAQSDRDVNMDPQDVSLDGCAEAQGGLQVGQALQHGAARARGWSPDDHFDEPDQVSACSELQGVNGALGGCSGGWVGFRLWNCRLGAGSGINIGDGREDKEGEQEDCRHLRK